MGKNEDGAKAGDKVTVDALETAKVDGEQKSKQNGESESTGEPSQKSANGTSANETKQSDNENNESNENKTSPNATLRIPIAAADGQTGDKKEQEQDKCKNYVKKSEKDTTSDYGKKLASFTGCSNTEHFNENFQEWFDDLTCMELDKLYATPASRDIIKDSLRGDGGYHEWFMVSKANTFKKWGISAIDMMENNTETDLLFFTKIERQSASGSKFIQEKDEKPEYKVESPHHCSRGGRHAHKLIAEEIDRIDKDETQKASKFKRYLAGWKQKHAIIKEGGKDTLIIGEESSDMENSAKTSACEGCCVKSKSPDNDGEANNKSAESQCEDCKFYQSTAANNETPKAGFEKCHSGHCLGCSCQIKQK